LQFFWVFPDEFHLATLSEFLNACAELNPLVKIKNIFCAIIDRLAVYALSEEGSGIPADFDLFKIFSDAAEKVITARENIPPEDIVAIQVGSKHNLILNQDHF
jgi:vacuolar protein sorting-associated protein 35